MKVYTGRFFRIFIHEKGWKVLIFAVIISFLLSAVLGSSMFQVKERTREGFFAIFATFNLISLSISFEHALPSSI